MELLPAVDFAEKGDQHIFGDDVDVLTVEALDGFDTRNEVAEQIADFVIEVQRSHRILARFHRFRLRGVPVPS